MATPGLLRNNSLWSSIAVFTFLLALHNFQHCNGNPLAELRGNISANESTASKPTPVSELVYDYEEYDSSEESSEEELSQPLQFHRFCAKNAVVKEDNLTVYTTCESDDEGWSGVITSRPLRVFELFEIVHKDRKDVDPMMRTQYVYDFGVTEFSPQDLEDEGFPHRMEDIESGNWITNWTIPVDLKDGDHVAIARLPNNTLQLFVNSIPLGEVATDVPERVYGYVEIYSGSDIEISIVPPDCQEHGLDYLSKDEIDRNESKCLFYWS